MTLEETKTAWKMSLSKSSQGFNFSVDDNLHFTSIGSTGSQLYSTLKGEYFVEKCLLMQWAKSTPSVIDVISMGFLPILSEEILLLFCFVFQLSHGIVSDSHL